MYVRLDEECHTHPSPHTLHSSQHTPNMTSLSCASPTPHIHYTHALPHTHIHPPKHMLLSLSQRYPVLEQLQIYPGSLFTHVLSLGHTVRFIHSLISTQHTTSHIICTNSHMYRKSYILEVPNKVCFTSWVSMVI